jgi:hypothetical protein
VYVGVRMGTRIVDTTSFHDTCVGTAGGEFQIDKSLRTYMDSESRETTTLIRFFNGLNLVGMLSHVFLPMMTAFLFVAFSGTCDVILAKYAISLERRQGRRPVAPMPFERVAATIKVMLGGCMCTGGQCGGG